MPRLCRVSWCAPKTSLVRIRGTIGCSTQAMLLCRIYHIETEMTFLQVKENLALLDKLLQTSPSLLTSPQQKVLLFERTWEVFYRHRHSAREILGVMQQLQLCCEAPV